MMPPNIYKHYLESMRAVVKSIADDYLSTQPIWQYNDSRVDKHIANAINYLTPTKGITNKSMTKKELHKRLEATEKKLNDLINDYNKDLDDIIHTLQLFAKTMGYTLGVEDYISYKCGPSFSGSNKVIKQRPILIPIKGKK